MSSGKVLFVDDDKDDLHMIKEVLAELEWSPVIEEAYNGAEALQRLHYMEQDGGLPFLVVLDINMPVLDGKKTLAIIKQTREFKDLPVVMFTTSASEADRAFCEGMGVDMVTKPGTYDDLKFILQQMLRDYKMPDA